MSTLKSPKASRSLNPALVRAMQRMAVAATEVEAALGAQTRVLTPADKKRALRLRKGGELVAKRIFDLAKSCKLDSEGLHSDEMQAHFARLDALSPLDMLLTTLSTRVADERFLAGGDAWEIALQFYALLQRRALVDRKVAEALAPVEEFFSNRHDSVLAGKPTKLQTRAKRKLAHAEELVAHAKDRVGKADAEAVAVAASPQPTAQPQPAAQSPQPQAQLQPPLPAKVTPSAAVNGASNGVSNGASNGVSYAASAANGANGAGSTG